MSGPKIDYVELERQRRAELERQQQERIRKIREETGKLNTEIEKTRAQIDLINNHLSLKIKDIENAEEMALTMQDYNKLKIFHKDKLIKALGINVPVEPEEISSCAQKLSSVTNSIMSSFCNEVKPFEERILDYCNQLENQKKVSSILNSFSSETNRIENIEDFDFSFKMNFVASSVTDLTIKERATQILSEIEEFVNSESIQTADLMDLLAIANNIYSRAFEAKSAFESASIEYEVTKHQITGNLIIFDDIYQDYYAKYIAYLELINRGKSSRLAIVPKRKYQFNSIYELQNEVLMLEAKTMALMESNYIREQIDEVMQQHGYNTSEEIVFQVNQSGNHYITVNNSGNSAIHVHISDKKQIMMEITGVGQHTQSGFDDSSNTDSPTSTMLPYTNLKSQEKDRLLAEQGEFCKLHPIIVEELNKRGIKTQMKSRKEPDIKYCSKIMLASQTVSPLTNDLINREYNYNESASKIKYVKKELKQRALK